METSPVFELIGVKDPSAIIVKNIFAERDNLVIQLKAVDVSAQNFVALAIPLVSNAKALLKSVEAARVQIKEPILKVGREIDDKAKEFRADLQAEVDRAERHIGEAVRREREAKEKIEREARNKQLDALRIEQEKVHALEMKKLEAKSEFAKGKIDADISRAQEQSTAVIHQQSAIIATAAVPVLTGGSQVRATYDVSVIDVNAAFKAAPQLFDVVLSKSKASAWLKLQPVGIVPVVPGLQITPQIKASIR